MIASLHKPRRVPKKTKTPSPMKIVVYSHSNLGQCCFTSPHINSSLKMQDPLVLIEVVHCNTFSIVPDERDYRSSKGCLDNTSVNGASCMANRSKAKCVVKGTTDKSHGTLSSRGPNKGANCLAFEQRDLWMYCCHCQKFGGTGQDQEVIPYFR